MDAQIAVGARVNYYPDAGQPPKLATVTGRLGSIWASLRCDDGEQVEQCRVGGSYLTSPRGNYCTLHVVANT